MEQQTVYLLSPLFTEENPLECGNPLNLIDKLSGEAFKLPAGYSISEICVQRASIELLDGSPLPSKVVIGTFYNDGATTSEFNISDLNSNEVVYIRNRPKPTRASTDDLYIKIDAEYCNCSLTQGQLYVVIKYTCIAMGPQSTKHSARQPIRYVIKNAPFGNPGSQN